jgi:hypothetical protein
MTVTVTRHAEARMSQRGVRRADLALIMETAERIATDRMFVTAASADEAIAKRKREIQQLEKLKGKTLVLDGNKVVTCYHARSRQQSAFMSLRRSFS